MDGTFILSTVGTSLIGGLKREAIIKITNQAGISAGLKFLASKPSHDRLCGAEINSLHSLIKGEQSKRIYIEEPIRLSFLVSDTEDGKWTGELLKRYFNKSKQWSEDIEADYTVVKGLVPDDPKEFSTTGLRNLIKNTAGQLKNSREKTKLINATGGFKAQISFAGLIGQIMEIPVVYMFETFPYCIEMPPMPVDFNHDLWLEHYDLFKKLSEQELMKENEIDLGDADRRFIELLDSEEIEGQTYFALSPILELMHQGFCSRLFTSLEKEPVKSLKEVSEKIQLPSDEHHYPKGFEIVLKRIAKITWVNRITSYEFRNSGRKSLLSRNPEQPDEIRFQWADDNNKACVFIVFTTAKNEGELRYCSRILNDIIQS